MKSISLLASSAALSMVCLSVSCAPKSDGAGGAAGSSTDHGGRSSSGGGGASAGEAGGGRASSGDAGDGGAAGDGRQAASDAGAAGQSGGDETAAAGAAGQGGNELGGCSSGVLFLGDPLYNDKPEVAGPKPAGQALLADPPIRNEAIAVIGSRLFIETETEIWVTDSSVKPAVLSRLAGQEGGGFVNAGVACKDTQFLVARDMTATADGKLVVVDYVAGAVIEITDPGGPNCKSNWVAGTHVKSADPGSAYPLSQGDRDGAGAQALFGGVGGGGGIHKVAVDPDGSIYMYDEGTRKFKKIATDAARTVSTIGALATDDNVMGLAFLNGKLYATGVDGSNDFLEQIDPAKYNPAKPTANVQDIFRARDHFAETESGHQAVISQVYADGDALIVSSQSGYVWRMATDGTVLATLAGTGPYLDYVGNFDPLVPHPANEWQLVNTLSNSDGGPWLARDRGHLYWSGGIGIGKYTLQFSCP